MSQPTGSETSAGTNTSNASIARRKSWRESKPAKAARHARRQERRADQHARREERRANRQQQKLERRAAKDNDQTPVAADAPATKADPKDDKWGRFLKFAAIIVLVMALFMPRILSSVMGGVFKIALLCIPAYLVYLFFFSKRDEKPKSEGDAKSVPVTDLDKPAAAPAHVPRRKMGPINPFALTPETPRRIPLRTRVTELTGSMSFAVLATVILTGAAAILFPVLQSTARISLFAAGTLVASWGVLLTAKTYEGSRASGGHRRMMHLLSGVLVGAMVFGLHQFCWFNSARRIPVVNSGGLVDSIGSLSLADGYQPTLAGYAVFFAALFVIRHWWRHADSLRRKRLAIGSVLLTTVAGVVVAMVLSFPIIWAVAWAAAISCVVHLSAVWATPEERRRLSETV